MFLVIQAKLLDPQFLAMMLVAISAAATVWTLATPLVESDGLAKRMKAVATERERIRARERERLARAQSKPSLRQEPKAYMRQVVDQFRLDRSGAAPARPGSPSAPPPRAAMRKV